MRNLQKLICNWFGHKWKDSRSREEFYHAGGGGFIKANLVLRRKCIRCGSTQEDRSPWPEESS